MIELVTLAEKRLAGQAQIFAGVTLPTENAHAGRVAPISARAASLPAERRARDGAALRARVPHRAGDPGLRRGAAIATLWPARAGDARSRHPHQGRAARRCRRRKRACSTPFKQDEQAARRRLCRRLRRHVRAPECPRRRRQDQARSYAARCAGARRRLFGDRQDAQGREDRRRRLRAHGRASSPTRRPSAASSRCPRPICSTWNTGASSRPSSRPRRASRSPARSPSSPAAARGIGAATAQGFRARGAEVAVVARRCASGRRGRPNDGFASPATSPIRRGARRLRRDRRRPSAASTSSSPTPGAPAGQDRRGRRSELCAKLRAQFLGPPDRWRGAVRGDARAGPRRLPAVQREQERVQPGQASARTAWPRRRAGPHAPVRGRSGPYGIRSNAVNADRIRTGLLRRRCRRARPRRGAWRGRLLRAQPAPRRGRRPTTWRDAFVYLAKATSHDRLRGHGRRRQLAAAFR